LRISRKQVKVKTIQYRTNEQIRSPEVRVIDEEGKNLGVMDTSAAVQLARERELDLVEVSPKANPPITKILDYGRFLYQKDKEARRQKAKAKKVEIKGIRLSLRISPHDRDFRLNQAKDFLEAGDKVKVEILLKGRERQYVNMAREVANQFIETLNNLVPTKIEQPLSFQGRRLSVTVGKK
jgi:translation initiation factor IF-3